jgi:hypothetical protein
MDFKTFTSQNGWFSLTLPADWEEYDDGEEDTYAFFNSKSWTGNFRVTPFRWTNIVDPEEDKAAKFIEEEVTENKGATIIKLGDFACAYYKKDFEQDGDKLIVYYWATGKKNNLFICSFTIDKKKQMSKQNKNELETVQNIIKSIKLN